MAALRKGKVYITLNGEEFYGWDLCLFLEDCVDGSWLDKCVFFGKDEKNELTYPKKHISNSVPKFGTLSMSHRIAAWLLPTSVEAIR